MSCGGSGLRDRFATMCSAPVFVQAGLRKVAVDEAGLARISRTLPLFNQSQDRCKRRPAKIFSSFELHKNTMQVAASFTLRVCTADAGKEPSGGRAGASIPDKLEKGKVLLCATEDVWRGTSDSDLSLVIWHLPFVISVTRRTAAS